VIEDTQWIDDASLDALGTVFEEIAERPWAVLMTRRPGPALFGALPPTVHTVIDLEPLEADAALELAAAAAGEEGHLRPDDWDRLVERSGGNPLFVLELVASATQQGHGDALPDSIEALVTSRLDELAARDRLLLREASVLGTVIDTDILAITLDDDAVRSPERWRDLEVFVTTHNGLLQFRHGLHRHVAYEGMSYRRRREAHRRVGEAIEARAGQRIEEWAELLSTHFDAAGARDRAWNYSRLAADRSRAKSANVEAAEFYRRALEHGRSLRMPKPELVAVAEALGDVSELAGRYDDAASAYRRATSLKVDGLDRVRLLHKEGVVRERIGRYSEALRWYRRGLNLLEREAETSAAAALRAQLSLAYAGVRYRQGRYDELVRWAEEAAANAAEAADRAALAHAYYLLDLGVFSLGRPVDDYRELALPIYEELRDDVGLCNVWNNLGIVDYHAGNWARALDSYANACQAAERAGDVVGVATGENNIGEILCDQGRIDEAVPMFRNALRVFRSAGYPAGVAVATSNLGWAEVLAGNVDQGNEHLHRAVAIFDDMGASAFVFMTRVRLVEARVVEHTCAEALDLANSLVGRLGEEGDDKPKVQLQRARAWALLALGRCGEAALAIDDAVVRAGDARYERAFNDLCRANIALVTGDLAAAEELQKNADAGFADLGVINLPRIPWTRPVE
jgi:tetratricopeptide (TPR) repeat protein